MIYTTNTGDTWDLIAYKTLGSEYLLPLLLEANPMHKDTFIFGGGIELTIPVLEDDEEIIDRPDWLDDIDELGVEEE